MLHLYFSINKHVHMYIYDRLRSTSTPQVGAVHWRHYLNLNHGPILGYSQIGVLSKLSYL